MKCPICGGNDAFLWDEDGMREPGRGIPVEIKCSGKCAGNVQGSCHNDPVHVADVTIDIIIKRGSIDTSLPQAVTSED